ncbi:unnamed protein product [Schistosoma mattheei]|uniref:Uncharacterized protein n=1 Tax=Schistosoma mattheei TaxID=31246 RepID=A0A183P746_9TREM|nr:unnamed protein product [Schistosoma mattheei]
MYALSFTLEYSYIEIFTVFNTKSSLVILLYLLFIS